MNGNLKPTLNIVGCGRVGRVLGRLLGRNNLFRVQDVLTRSQAGAADAAAFVGAGAACSEMAALRIADVTLLGVPDDRIAAACAALAARGLLSQNSIVFHCSGALSSQALSAAIACGAAVASVHPVRSFADPEMVAQQFAGTFCGIEGDARALQMLQPALLAIGAQPVALDADAKTLYHAASVFACNYLTTVVDTALRAYSAAGIEPELARRMAQPLIAETLANIFRLGPEQALTGPIARGDLATVARQQAAVAAWDGAAGTLYEALADATRQLAQRRLL
ncbi:Rossmann-like and DUF2520 domain-containing protein [Herminiimonas sp. CN]|uniref:Rossmann-like and DUF2520 domain-containing protein n=1 Tax=Herminiimonas sp. CN TaxID=1349818 RepID=UPI00054EB0AA|nr:Rossmann-like and DUF2520 domain-containing protein [Herminiimonas sp. CN]